MEAEKKADVVVFLADDNRSKTGDPMEDEYEIIIPIGYSNELPYGKIVNKLKDDEVSKYKLLGSGMGINFKHACQLGEHHCIDFYERLICYRVVNSSQAEILDRATGQEYITVEFYE